MKHVQEYLQHAEDCEKRAAATTDEFQKETLLDLAQGWRRLAEERKRNLDEQR